MKIAPKHPQELARLEDLQNYDILDTPADPKFDGIVELASVICGTQVAVVSLVDAQRQWFKAKKGVEVEETSRDIAFCSHAILQDEVFEVSNASNDDRFSDNPLVKDGLKIRFYAGAPLVSSSGLPMGTLCVIDNQPMTLTPKQKLALKTLAGHVVDLMELRLKNSQLIKANIDIKEKQDQILTMAKHHFLNHLAGGVIEKLEKPVEELSELVTVYELTEVQKPLSAIKSVLGSLDKMISWSHSNDKISFDLSEVVETMIWLTKSYCEKRNIVVVSNLKPGLRAKGNQNQISQVFMQLFNNSARALEEASVKRKVITISGLEKDSGIELKFIDSGKGLKPQELKTLFKPFTPGLGLYLVKSLMIENGGDVTFEDSEANTTFRLTLPAAA